MNHIDVARQRNMKELRLANEMCELSRAEEFEELGMCVVIHREALVQGGKLHCLGWGCEVKWSSM